MIASSCIDHYRLLQAVAEFVGDALFVKDVEGRYQLLNTAGAAMVGKRPEELLGKNDFDIFPEEREAVNDIREVDARVLTTGVPVTYPEILPGPGPRRYLLTTKAPYRDDQGKCIGLLGMSRDVTAFHLAEQALRESEQRLSLAMQAGGMGACELDAATGRMIWSEHTFRMLGYEPSPDGHATLAMWTERVHPDDREVFEQALNRFWVDRAGFSVQFRIVRASDGRVVWLSLIGRPVSLADGQKRGIGIIQDITAQKDAAEEIVRLNRDLQRRVSELQTLLKVLPVGIGIAHDPTCQRIEVNPYFARLMGIAPDANASLTAPADQRPMHFSMWSHGRELPPGELPLQMAARQGHNSRDLELQMRFDDGRIIDLLEFAVPLFDESGTTRGAVGVFVDLTEMNKAKDQARRQQDELAHLARVVTMGEMASGLAHELNQPLGATQNYAVTCATLLDEYLETGADAETVKRVRALLSDLEGEIGRAGEIIRRLRAFVRKQTPRRAPVDLLSMVQSAMQLLVFEVRRWSVRFVLNAEPSIPKVVADRVQIEQVLVNLLRNGIEAMQTTEPKRRLLEVRVSGVPETRMCRVSVTDQGAGIDDANRERIFDSFFTTKPAGMGIGLTISRSIIESHGGRLGCSSDAAGTEFHFTLPFATETHQEYQP